MKLQMGKDLKQKAPYDYWKPYLYEKGENKMKRYYSLLSGEEADYPRVSTEEASSHEASHKCNICGKSFDSGKALGGHKRSHFQASEKTFKTLFSDNSKEGNNRTFNDEKKDHICSVCKKIFPTKKALYGHMRSHPDRVFKGVSPPTNHHHQIHNLSHDQNKNCSSNSQSSISSMEQNNDDQEDGFVAPKGYSDTDVSKPPLPKWKKREKRGRKCSESYEAAITLMQLSGNTNNLCSAMSIKKLEPLKSFVELSSMNKRERGESSSSGKENAVKKIKFVFSGSVKLGNKSDDVVGTSNNSTVSLDSHMLKKGKGLCESESKVKETSLSEDILVVQPSELSAGPKRLDIDLNEPCVMELED